LTFYSISSLDLGIKIPWSIFFGHGLSASWRITTGVFTIIFLPPPDLPLKTRGRRRKKGGGYPPIYKGRCSDFKSEWRGIIINLLRPGIVCYNRLIILIFYFLINNLQFLSFNFSRSMILIEAGSRLAVISFHSLVYLKIKN